MCKWIHNAHLKFMLIQLLLWRRISNGYYVLCLAKQLVVVLQLFGSLKKRRNTSCAYCAAGCNVCNRRNIMKHKLSNFWRKKKYTLCRKKESVFSTWKMHHSTNSIGSVVWTDVSQLCFLGLLWSSFIPNRGATAGKINWPSELFGSGKSLSLSQLTAWVKH